MAPTLYVPQDVNQAHGAWGANCAPAALAAFLGVSLTEIRAAFPWFPDRPWTNPTQLNAAIRAAGARVVEVVGPATREMRPLALPANGIAVVQIDGGWCKPGVDPRAAYRYTHCVAARKVGERLHVYDINAGTDEVPGDWLPAEVWERSILQALIASYKRATGWFLKVAIEVSVPGAAPAGVPNGRQ